MVLLQAGNDDFLSSSQLSICFIEHLVKEYLVAESLDLFLLSWLERAGHLHNYSGYQMRLNLIHAVV